MNNNYPILLNKENNNSINYYIIFIVNGRKYAVNIKNVIEVINIPDMEIPEKKMPKGIIGMFNYNGEMIKAVDLSPWLGFETIPFTINNQLIITVIDDNCFAIHTESIENIIQFEEEKIQKIPYNSNESILQEVYKSDDDTSVNIINLNKLKQCLSYNNISIEQKINYLDLFPKDEKSIQILKLRARQHKIDKQVLSFPINLDYGNQYILFTLNEQNYYLDLKYVKEFTTIKRLNITKLPYTQDFIKGIINIKGEFLVVIDLKKFLNNSSQNDKKAGKLIIVEGKNFDIAFLVDEIKYIKNLKNLPKSPVNMDGATYIYSEIMEENVLYSILNFEKIINDERLYININ